MVGHGPLAVIGRRLHQDVLDEAAAPTDLARTVVASMSLDEREALRKWLEAAIDRCTPAELKGHLNRATSELRFGTKGAHTFLSSVLQQLR